MTQRAIRVCLTAAVALVVWLAPKIALACPVCAGRSDNGIIRVIGLGAMITLPFVVSYFVYRAVRGATPPMEGVDQ